MLSVLAGAQDTRLLCVLVDSLRSEYSGAQCACGCSGTRLLGVLVYSVRQSTRVLGGARYAQFTGLLGAIRALGAR